MDFFRHNLTIIGAASEILHAGQGVGDKRARAPGASLQGQFTMEKDPLMLSWNGVKQVGTLSLTENF